MLGFKTHYFGANKSRRKPGKLKTKLMKKISTLLVLLVAFAFGAMAQVTPMTIAQARVTMADGNPADSGMVIQVSGIAYGPNSYPTANGMVFVLNDHTTGIRIYSKHKYAGYQTLHDGDSVTVVGTLSGYHGSAEVSLVASAPLDTIYQIGTGTIDTPLVVIAPSSFTDAELIQVNNVNMSSATGWVQAGHSFTARVGTLPIFIDSFMNAAMFNAAQPQGVYNIVGFGDQYQYSPPYTGGFNINPRSLADFHLVATGIDNVANSLTAAIYPNPTSTQLTVTLSSDKFETITAQMFDVTGKMVLNETKELVSGANELQFNTANFTNGMYILELRTAEKSLNTKIVVNK